MEEISEGMSFAEARRWVVGRPMDLELNEMYPDLTTEQQRRQAWVDENLDSIREAMTVLIAARPDQFEPGTTVDPTGSVFSGSSAWDIPFYWNPTSIAHEHEGFIYTVSTPHHVAALHAIPDRDAALAYLYAHCDKRKPVRPKRMTVHTGWDPYNEPVASAPASVSLEGRIRYTLSDWRKLHMAYRVHLARGDILAAQRYYLAHYDLKEVPVLDAEGQVVSSEQGGEYVPEQVSRL
ncbi:hypothetical protein FB451DRAFT_87770 [Mycena latifolia]|nr:hypothetical protein FB451DRAFT_87770 [Mycena latifolia]